MYYNVNEGAISYKNDCCNFGANDLNSIDTFTIQLNYYSSFAQFFFL